MKDNFRETKISPGFAQRLARFRPQQKVRAIVLLRSKAIRNTMGGRLPASRKGLIDSMRKSAEKSLTDIDAILNRFDGKRLTKNPDVLGSISVRATPAAIKALAASKHVKAILEDQKISLIP